jgi:hypothetical protein
MMRKKEAILCDMHQPTVTRRFALEPGLVNLGISDILIKMLSVAKEFWAKREHLPIAFSSSKSFHCVGVMTTFLKSSETMPLFK